MQLGGKTCEGDSNEDGFVMRATAGTEGPPQRGGNLPTCSRPPEHPGSEHGLLGPHVAGRPLLGCLTSGPAVKTLAHWFGAHWELQKFCLFFLSKWKPISLK